MGLGTSLISGIFGSKKKNEEVVNRVDYARMVKDAEAAGFNPLTALRNGGAAGFSVTSQPVLSSSGQAIAGVANAFGDFLQNFDPFEDKMREVQYRTMQAQLDGLQLDNSSKRKLMFDPPAVSGRRTVTAGPVLGSKASKPQPPSLENPTLTNPFPMSDGSLVNPGFVDAEAWETRYGDIAQEIGGMINLGADAYANFRSMYDNRRKLTPKEKKEIDESWLPSWVPRFSVK